MNNKNVPRRRNRWFIVVPPMTKNGLKLEQAKRFYRQGDIKQFRQIALPGCEREGVSRSLALG